MSVFKLSQFLVLISATLFYIGAKAGCVDEHPSLKLTQHSDSSGESWSVYLCRERNSCFHINPVLKERPFRRDRLLADFVAPIQSREFVELAKYAGDARSLSHFAKVLEDTDPGSNQTLCLDLKTQSNFDRIVNILEPLMDPFRIELQTLAVASHLMAGERVKLIKGIGFADQVEYTVFQNSHSIAQHDVNKEGACLTAYRDEESKKLWLTNDGRNNGQKGCETVLDFQSLKTVPLDGKRLKGRVLLISTGDMIMTFVENDTSYQRDISKGHLFTADFSTTPPKYSLVSNILNPIYAEDSNLAFFTSEQDNRTNQNSESYGSIGVNRLKTHFRQVTVGQ